MGVAPASSFVGERRPAGTRGWFSGSQEAKDIAFRLGRSQRTGEQNRDLVEKSGGYKSFAPDDSDRMLRQAIANRLRTIGRGRKAAFMGGFEGDPAAMLK